MKIKVHLLPAITIIIGIANASTMIFEAGPFAIIMNENIEILDVGGSDVWDMIGFAQVDSRELIKNNYYNLEMNTAFVKDDVGIISKYPMQIEISEKPIEDLFLFTPTAVKEVTVGKIRPVKTTLYTGNTTNDFTPYFVNFTNDGIYIVVYEPNSSESIMTEFLEGFSVIWKNDLEKYNLSSLWSED